MNFGIVTPPEGTTFACQIVVGTDLLGNMKLEQRLPSGTPLDPNNPAHLFGLFVVQNAQQLLSLAMETAQQQRARAIVQQDEVIVSNALQGA